LDTSTWTVGSGSVVGFSQNGTNAENIRELGVNHIGDEMIIWKAVPDEVSGPDGGWNSSYLSVDNNFTYRFSVWIKKSSSIIGQTYFGPKSGSGSLSKILNLTGTINTNPYFWSGDLPMLDRWYLLVGFVHHDNYQPNATSINMGRIYDGVTGQVVLNMTDYKFSNDAAVVRHRAYLYYSTNTSNRQYFVSPRVDLVNGFEPTINELLGINENSQLIVQYDAAGNQNVRFYCPIQNCVGPLGQNDSGKDPLSEPEEIIAANSEKEDSHSEVEHDIAFYPNPVEDYLLITSSSQNHIDFSKEVIMYNTLGAVVKSIKFESSSEMKVDMINQPSGVYFIHVHLMNEQSITKKIIKN